MRQYVVIGLGSFGSNVAKTLFQKGEQVMAIDMSRERVNSIKEFVTEAIIADARDKEVLTTLGADKMDCAIVSLGESIEASTLVCLHLRELGVPQVVVKAVSEDHQKILEVIGAHQVIFPEKDSAIRLANSLLSINILDYISLAPGFSMIELPTPNAFIGKRVSELDLRNTYKVQIVIIKETIPERINPVPGPNDVLKDSDILVLSGRDEDLARIRDLADNI